MNEAEINILVVIAKLKFEQAIIDSLSENDARFFNVAYAKGLSRSDTNLQSALGLNSEKHEVVITSIINKQKSDDMLKILEEKFEFDKPSNGIAFTLPVGCVKYKD